MPSLFCLHAVTAQSAVFQSLAENLAPQASIHHAVAEGLLAAACSAGVVTPDIRARLRQVLAHLGAQANDVILCTCSTLGGAAEEEGAALGLRVMRVDRPMAEAAVTAGPQCLVVACLDSTVAPTLALLQSCADRAGTALTPRVLSLPHLWHYYEAGHRAAFAQAVADAVLAALVQGAAVHSVVLAQASMAGAALLCAGAPVPVFSSPRLGVTRALALLTAA